KSDLPVLKNFWNYYKLDFLKSNLLGVFINVLLIFIAADIFYITLNEQLAWTHIPLFAFILIVVLFLLFIFPSFAHYDLKVIPLIKNTFLFIIINPIKIFFIIIFSFILIFVLFLLFIFPCFSHYYLKVIPLIKNTFLIMIISPIHSFLMIICLVSVYFIMQSVPALFFIFGGSTYAFITTWLSLHAFDKIHKKQEGK